MGMSMTTVSGRKDAPIDKPPIASSDTSGKFPRGCCQVKIPQRGYQRNALQNVCR